jgi:hypothetical protein
MRVVVNPTYWTGNVVGHSISLSALSTAKALSELPHLHVIVPVPKDRSLWVYSDSDLDGIDEVVEVEYLNNFMTHFATRTGGSISMLVAGTCSSDVMLGSMQRWLLQMENWAMVGNYRTKFFLPAPMDRSERDSTCVSDI